MLLDARSNPFTLMLKRLRSDHVTVILIDRLWRPDFISFGHDPLSYIERRWQQQHLLVIIIVKVLADVRLIWEHLYLLHCQIELLHLHKLIKSGLNHLTLVLGNRFPFVC